MKKCKVCGKEYDIILGRVPLCAVHYVEKEDAECLHWDVEMSKIGALIGKSKESSEKILAEIKKRVQSNQ